MDQTDDKKRLITAAALKRFAHFGIAKTTLQEIAEDAGLSKANVYYYFADKEAIIESAIDAIVEEFKAKIQSESKKLENAGDGFITFLKVRKAFLDKYFFLYSSDLSELAYNSKRLAKYVKAITDFEEAYISNLFQKGIERKEFVTINAKPTSELYLETIRGLACISQVCAIENVRFDKAHIDKIHEKQLKLTHIFLNGISNTKSANNVSL